MVREFHETTTDIRAGQVWMILIGAASNRQTITYQELAVKMEFTRRSTHILSQYLDPVARFCRREGLPALTVLVVSRQTGQPGEGLRPLIKPGQTYEAERELVYRENWYRMRIPSPASFRQE